MTAPRRYRLFVAALLASLALHGLLLALLGLARVDRGEPRMPVEVCTLADRPKFSPGAIEAPSRRRETPQPIDFDVKLAPAPLDPSAAPVAAAPSVPGSAGPAASDGAAGRAEDGPGEAGASGAGSGAVLPAPERTCRSVVYVLDRSISMGFGGALTAARRAVLDGLRRLPADVRFQVVAYNRRAEPLTLLGRKALAPATADARRQAAQALADLQPLDGTDHFRAVERALAFRPDMICLVTDAGELSLTEVETLTRLNRRVTEGRTCIHAVELSRRPAGGPESPLQRLAALNHGSYRRLPPPP
jgi:hypothetical protein